MLEWNFRTVAEADMPPILVWFTVPDFRFRHHSPDMLGEAEIERLVRDPGVRMVERKGVPVGLAVLELQCKASQRAAVQVRLAGLDEAAAAGALRTWVDLAFRHLGLRRLVASCPEFDEIGLKSLALAGFVREGALTGVVFHRGRYWSNVHFAMLRREWEEDAREAVAGLAQQ